MDKPSTKRNQPCTVWINFRRIQNVVLHEPFVNHSLTGLYQEILKAVAIHYSGRCHCGEMAVVERLELE